MVSSEEEALERAASTPTGAPAVHLEPTAAEAAQVVERVRDALNKLPESQRIVVHMHRYVGLSFPEIGKALGISAGAVKIRAFRAYEQLRKLLRPLREPKFEEAAR
jgi:RNA polymerase sigma factor (sigma-70 family)